MENKIALRCRKAGRRISIDYDVSGPWSEAFNLKGITGWFANVGMGEHGFYCEYEEDIESVPDGIAIIPMLANLAPIAWLYNATVELDEIDADCLSSLEDVRFGYAAMYPMFDLQWRVEAKAITKNRIGHPKSPPLVLFSGGVDAVFSMLGYRPIRPTILTIWGADMFFSDEPNWRRTSEANRALAERFGVTYTSLKSSFRFFMNYTVLDQRLSEIGGSYWHDFQYGIGLLGLAAPLAWQRGTRTVVISSSYSSKDAYRVRCGSDPTLDAVFRFFDCQCQHYEYTVNRQDKVAFICSQARLMREKIPLRVCFTNLDGTNCCKCDKCMRTIFAIYAEGCDPRDFNFPIDKAKSQEMIAAMASGAIQRTVFWKPITHRLRQMKKQPRLVAELLAQFDEPRAEATRPQSVYARIRSLFSTDRTH